jgi:DnaJ-class molecular chaperone
MADIDYAENVEGVCNRCEGRGILPSDPKGRVCGKCYGTGAYNPNFNFRTDGRVEEMCEHGIGHTVSIIAVSAAVTEREKNAWWSHGCDMCCGDMVKYYAPGKAR